MASLLENLRESRKPLEALVHAWVDDLLDRPLSSLFDSAELAETIASGIRGVAQDPNNEAWLREQIGESLDELRSVRIRGKLKNKLPKRALAAARELAAQPFVLDEELASELLDHPAVHAMVREVLQRSLLGFAKQITELFPGGKMFTGLMGKARGIASAGLGGMGAALEHRANEFVEDTLAPSMDLAASRIADEEFSEELADWRGHILDVLLDQKAADLLEMLDQADPGALADSLAAFLRGVAEWDKLESTIESALEAAMDRAGDSTLREVIGDTSLEKDWRPAVEKQIVDSTWPFLSSDAFAAWLKAHE